VTRSRSKLAQRTAAEDAYADALQPDVMHPGPSTTQPPIPAHQEVTRPDR